MRPNTTSITPGPLGPQRRSDVNLHRRRRKARWSGHRRESGPFRRSSPVVPRVGVLVRLLHVRPLLAQILGARILDGATEHNLPELVLTPECGGRSQRSIRRRPTSRPTLQYVLFTLQLLDRGTSRGQIQTELLVHGILFRDRLRDVQQPRGSSELQLEFLVRSVRSESGHAEIAPRNFEAMRNNPARQNELLSNP